MTVRTLVVTVVALAASSGPLLAQARTVRMVRDDGTQQIYALLLPRSYEESDRRYPVVYLFHGSGQDHTAWMARSAFREMAREQKVIVVMPAADRSFGGRDAEARAAYHDFVATGLVDHVDAQYRTIATREGRAIAGLSMGGAIAVETALAHPARFGTVGSFSAALGAVTNVLLDSLPAPPPYVYLSCGTADPLLPATRRFVERLAARGVPHEYHEAPGLGHAWSLWDRDVVAFFDLLEARGVAPESAQR